MYRMINPIQLVQMIRSNGNPMQALMAASKQNPHLNQIMQMTNGKTPNEMQHMVYDLAKQRGVDLNRLAQSLGITLPK